ncbi:MAG: acyl carrier protein [Acidobacteria bacterium]|nr:acyl carrier protein [Acidobacteriota bacterium]
MELELAEKVVGIVAAVTRRAPEGIRRDATFDEQGIDSLDRINILFELESAFNISIPDEEARNIRSIDEIVERLKARLPAPAESAGA